MQGYSIIQVEERRGNPFLTETEFGRARERLKAFARKRRFEKAAKHFTAELRKELNIRFNEKPVARLYEMTQR